MSVAADETTTITRRVYFADTDAGGVVHHATHVRWFEQARTEWLHARGFTLAHWRQEDVVFVVVRLEVAYLLPLPLDAKVAVTATRTAQRPVSVTFTHAIMHGGKLACTGFAKLVCISLGDGRPVRIPRSLAGGVALRDAVA